MCLIFTALFEFTCLRDRKQSGQRISDRTQAVNHDHLLPGSDTSTNCRTCLHRAPSLPLCSFEFESCNSHCSVFCSDQTNQSQHGAKEHITEKCLKPLLFYMKSKGLTRACGLQSTHSQDGCLLDYTLQTFGVQVQFGRFESNGNTLM